MVSPQQGTHKKRGDIMNTEKLIKDLKTVKLTTDTEFLVFEINKIGSVSITKRYKDSVSQSSNTFYSAELKRILNIFNDHDMIYYIDKSFKTDMLQIVCFSRTRSDKI